MTNQDFKATITVYVGGKPGPEPCQHAFVSWGSDARYERCRLCGLARRADQRLTDERCVNPMAVRHGPGPEGARCGGCAHLFQQGGTAGRYFKCALRGNTRGPGTDMRKKWPACGRYWQGEGGNYGTAHEA